MCPVEAFYGLQGASYWAGLLSMQCQLINYCQVHKKCGHRGGTPRPLPWQPVSLQTAPLLTDASTGQLLGNVLQHHMQENIRPCDPCTAYQQEKMAMGIHTDREQAVIYDTRQAVHLPVMLLVSVWSLQASRE